MDELLVRMIYDECQAKVVIELIGICLNSIKDYEIMKGSFGYAIRKN